MRESEFPAAKLSNFIEMCTAKSYHVCFRQACPDFGGGYGVRLIRWLGPGKDAECQQLDQAGATLIEAVYRMNAALRRHEWITEAEMVKHTQQQFRNQSEFQ